MNEAKHIAIFGKSGTGKSEYIKNLVAADIANGRGVCVIDPHGDLAASIPSLISRNRHHDLIYIDPADTERPIGLNFVTHIPLHERPRHTAALVAAFLSRWGEEAVGNRSTQLLRNSIRVLMDNNRPLVYMQRLLTDKHYRTKLLRKVSDPYVMAYWTDIYNDYNDRLQQEVRSPITNKLDALFNYPAIRNIIGQPSNTIDLRKALDDEKIIVISLSQGQLGEEAAQTFGVILTSMIFSTFLQRTDNRTPCYMYADEFQTYTNPSFAKALAELRKYGLSLTMANQYLDQLPKDVFASIMGNVEHIVSFRLGITDADRLIPQFGFSSINALTDLPNYHYRSTISSEPIIYPAPPPSTPIANADTLRALSRRAWGRDRNEVERIIQNGFTDKYLKRSRRKA